MIKTGFGRVNAIAAKRFQEAGWDVASVAGLTKEPPVDDEGIRFYVPSDSADVLGIKLIPEAIEDFKPDVVYTTADPGSVTALAYGIPDMPAFIYTPIEGEPISNRNWKAALSTLPLATVSKYGADLIEKTLLRSVPYYYHGVDHNTFKVVDGMRDAVREQMGWTDKFIITCVSTNVRRKQIPRLIEAVSMLKERYKQKDIVLYLHTVPFQNYWLEGWNLIEVAGTLGVGSEVMFHPYMHKFGSSIPESTSDASNPGLAELYQASDLFVLPSQVEGFGLPIAEAMACGVPVLVTKYAAGWEIAQPAGRGIPVGDWEIHKSGTMYANVSVEGLAKEILRLKRNPKERARMSQAGLERAKDFTWDAFRDNLIPSVESSIDGFETRRTETEEEDKGNVSEQRGQEVGTGTSETSGSPTEGEYQPEGNSEDISSPVTQDPNRTQEKEEASA